VLPFTMSPPSCFGSGYDNEAPRCIACSLTQHCRQEVIRMSSATQFAPPGVVQPPQTFYPVGPAPFIPQVPPMMVQTQPAQYKPPPWNPPQPAPAVFRVPVQQAPIQQHPIAQHAMPTHMIAPWSPIHFPVPSSLPFSPAGYLGYYQDPGAASIWAIPPVIHPQQPGETFWRRARIEGGRHLGTSVLQFGLWMLRQMVFQPPQPQQPHTIEVPPAS
jgi:hypothetical protein